MNNNDTTFTWECPKVQRLPPKSIGQRPEFFGGKTTFFITYLSSAYPWKVCLANGVHMNNRNATWRVNEVPGTITILFLILTTTVQSGDSCHICRWENWKSEKFPRVLEMESNTLTLLTQHIPCAVSSLLLTSFPKHLLNSYYLAGSVLCAGGTAKNKIPWQNPPLK